MTEEERVRNYLTASYRRSVLGHNVAPDSLLVDDAAFKEALQAELSRINRLGLGANLASRDFVTYRHKMAIEAALAKLAEKKDAPG